RRYGRYAFAPEASTNFLKVHRRDRWLGAGGRACGRGLRLGLRYVAAAVIVKVTGLRSRRGRRRVVVGGGIEDVALRWRRRRRADPQELIFNWIPTFRCQPEAANLGVLELAHLRGEALPIALFGLDRCEDRRLHPVVQVVGRDLVVLVLLPPQRKD